MAFFKLLFSKKTKYHSQNVLSPEFPANVKKAILLLASAATSPTDEDFLKSLADSGISDKEATEILLFLPIAFVRHLLPNLKWHDTYNEFVTDKKHLEKKYSETDSFQIIWDVTNNYFKNSPAPDSIIKIAGRSAEFHVINKLLLDNEDINIDEIKITKTTIIR